MNFSCGEMSLVVAKCSKLPIWYQTPQKKRRWPEKKFNCPKKSSIVRKKVSRFSKGARWFLKNNAQNWLEQGLSYKSRRVSGGEREARSRLSADFCNSTLVRVNFERYFLKIRSATALPATWLWFPNLLKEYFGEAKIKMLLYKIRVEPLDYN